MVKTLHHILRAGLCSLIIGLSTMIVFAQDIHYSQFSRSPIYINPALAGVFRGDLRFVSNYRSQWSSVPVSYKTFSASIEQKFININQKNSLFATGLIFNYDEAGDLEYSNTNVSVVGSYTHRLAEKHFVTGGLTIGIGQRRLDDSNLRVDRQYNGDTFDPNIATGESGLNARNFYADISAGLNYHFQNPEKRLRLDAGGSIFHFNSPNASLYDDEGNVKLDPRLNIYGISSFKIGEDFDMGIRAIGQFQGTDQEIVLGGSIKYHLEQRKSRGVAVAFGVAHRLGDAWIPTFSLDFHNWTFGISYDVNSSDFNTSSSRRGGPELSLIYIFSKVRPPKEFEICPIF